MFHSGMSSHADKMAQDYARFRGILEAAARRIGPQYFSLPVAGQAKEIVRERNFCAELHHQLRTLFEAEEFDLLLGAEIDKSGHPIIDMDVIPDLIVHDAGNMDRNLCIIEVKPISGATKGFHKDIRALRRFAADFAYHASVLLVFGSHPDGDTRVRAKLGIDVASLRAAGITVLWLSEAHGPLIELT